MNPSLHSLLLAAVTILAMPGAALARSSPETETFIGLGLKREPAYDGARGGAWQAVPIVRYEGRHVFARTSQGFPEAGAFIQPLSSVRLGVSLSLTDGRKVSDAGLPRVRGIEDLGQTTSLGPFFELRTQAGPVPLEVTARWREALRSGRGAEADMRLAFGLYGSAEVRLQGYGQLTWADADALASAYGISAAQSAASGLAAYRPGSGLRHASFGLRGQWDLRQHWAVVGALEHRRLSDRVTDSPLVASKTAGTATVGLVYRFR